MVNTVAPVWDGNETWLVLGGAGLLGGVSARLFGAAAARSTCRSSLMLMGLILRGVAFEFRFKADSPPARSGIRPSPAAPTSRPSSRAWRSAPSSNGLRGDRATYDRRRARLADAVQPLHRPRRRSSAYALLGCTWLIMKTEGALQRRMVAVARRIVPGAAGGDRLSSACGRRWPIRTSPRGGSRVPNILYFSPVPWCWRHAGTSALARTAGADRRCLGGAVPAFAVPVVPRL